MSPTAYFCCDLRSEPPLDGLSPPHHRTFLYCSWFFTRNTPMVIVKGQLSRGVRLPSPKCLQNRKWRDDEATCEYSMVFLQPGGKLQAEVLCLCQSCFRENLQSSEGAFPNTTSKTSACMCACVFSCKDFSGTSLCERAQMFGLSASPNTTLSYLRNTQGESVIQTTMTSPSTKRVSLTSKVLLRIPLRSSLFMQDQRELGCDL